MSAVAMQSTQPTTVSQLTHTERRKQPLRASVQSALERYFRDLDGHDEFHWLLLHCWYLFSW